MQQAPQCAVHGSVMVWKTVTAKKDGKQYSFWSCGTRNADNSFCTYKAPKEFTPPPKPETQQSPQYVPKPLIEAYRGQFGGVKRGSTDEMIAAQVSLKSAVEFYAGKTTTQEAVVSTAQIFLNFLLGQQPMVKEPELPTVQVEEEEMPLPDVPF